METTGERKKWKYLSEIEVRYKVKRKGITADSPLGIKRVVETIQSEDLAVEKMWAVYMDNKMVVVGYTEISSGTLSESLVHARNVFQGALLTNAAGFILAHNHPSGVLTPSKEDVTVTRRLREAGDMMGIRLIDHVIVGESGFYYSFKEEGMM